MKTWYEIIYMSKKERPKMRFGINFSATEYQKLLTLSTKIKYCIIPVKMNPKGIKSNCKAKKLFLPDIIYATREKSLYLEKLDDEMCEKCPFKSIGIPESCDEVWVQRDKKRIYTAHDGNIRLKWSFYLPWRRGTQPDYSDFINPVKEFLKVVEDEFKDRLKETHEPTSSSKELLQERTDSLIPQKEKQPSEPKMRIIRKGVTDDTKY